MPSLGIDQGATKTLAVVSDRGGRLIGKGVSAGACHFYDGMGRAMNAAQAAASMAMAHARVAPNDIRFVSAGMAGANWPEEITSLEEGLRATLSVDAVKVYNDCLIAMRGGTAKACCGVICAGTGLNAALRAPDGTTRIYNNYVEDVDQGARGLGMRALQAIFLSEIGALPPTVLTDRVLRHFALGAVDELLLAYQRQQLKRPIQEVSSSLFEAADESDPVALRVIGEFGVSVSRYVVAGIRKNGLEGADLDVVLSGGIFKARSRLLVETIGAAIHGVAPRANVVNALFEPVVGATLLVLDKEHDGSIPADVMHNCRTSAEDLGLIRLPRSDGDAAA